MVKTDPRVDTYIDKVADFAKPILMHLRALVHKTCPDVEESWKWSFPVFIYKGDLMCTMAAFKHHCAFGFWKQSLIADENNIFKKEEASAGSLGLIKSLKDLPSDTVLKRYINAAMKLNDEGIKVARPKPAATEKKELIIPDYVTLALKKNTVAEKAFHAFSYSHKNEYLQWFEEAKTNATREKRIAQAIEWITEGKSRNWKYPKG